MINNFARQSYDRPKKIEFLFEILSMQDNTQSKKQKVIKKKKLGSACIGEHKNVANVSRIIATF